MISSRCAVAWVAAALTAAALDAGHSAMLNYRWIPWFSFLGAAAIMWVSRTSSRDRWRQLCLFLGWYALIGVYALNPTHRWEVGRGLWPANPVPGLPGSAYVPGTLDALAIAAAAIAIFMLGRTIRGRDIIAIQWLAVIGGAVMATVVIQQHLGVRYYLQSTATFVNVNHFAALANLLLPVVLVTGTRYQYRAAQAGRPSNPSGLCFMAAALLGASIWLSGSRMGMVMLGCNLVAWALLQRYLDRSYGFMNPAHRLWNRWLPMLTGAVAAIALVIAAVRIVTHGTRVWGDLQFRFRIAADTLAIWRDNPWWGTGPGTFTMVFPYYQSEALQDYSIRFAHNDPLQFLAEYGVWGVGLTLLALGWAFRLCKRNQRNHDEEWPRFHELETPGYVFGLTTVVLHSLIDFPFRMPVIFLTAILWLSMIGNKRRKQKTENCGAAAMECGDPASSR